MSEAISSAAATSANPSDQTRIGESHGDATVVGAEDRCAGAGSGTLPVTWLGAAVEAGGPGANAEVVDWGAGGAASGCGFAAPPGTC